MKLVFFQLGKQKHAGENVCDKYIVLLRTKRTKRFCHRETDAGQ